MGMSDHERYAEAETRNIACDALNASSASSTPGVCNVIPGQIMSIHHGLWNVGIRVRIGERTDLRARWPLGSKMAPGLKSGHPVKAVIPAEAVQLESGCFGLGKRRWNRWVGRIVGIESQQEKSLATVQLHNDAVTLRCCGSVAGSNWTPQLWDTAYIVVDPTQIRLDTSETTDVAPSMGPDAGVWDSFGDARVWLKAEVTEIGESTEGKFLSLLIGTARVSVFIRREEDRFNRWSSGMTIDMHVGRYDAWLKPCGTQGPPVACGVLYLDSPSLAPARYEAGR